MNTPLAFVDCETTGLDPRFHEVWEVALILRRPDDEDVEYLWQLPVNLGRAEAIALKVGRFYERRSTPDKWTGPEVFARDFARLTDGAHLVGAVPSFDDGFLKRLLRVNHQCPGWSHRLICVETLAAGKLGQPTPMGLSQVADELGVLVEDEHRHTALGDARLARSVYNAVVLSVV